MRYRFIATTLAVSFAAFAALIAPIAKPIAKAEDAAKDVKGLFLMSDYPAVTLRPGETSSISLKLQNYDLPPERLALSVSGVPAGWTATLMGGGQPVGAAMPATNASVPLELRLDVPKNATVGTETLTVTAAGGSSTVTLPIAVTLAKDLPAKLTLTPQLPQLRGTSKSSFEFQLAIKNDSGKKLTVSLSAQTPQNFDASFSEQYGSQELNAVPIEAGQTKNVKLKVTPPNTAAAGSYKVVARVGAEDAVATTELTIDITGQPKLDISGRDGLLSTRATAGKETSVPIIITNTGTAPADSDRAQRIGAQRLEDHLRSEDHRSHRAECQQGSAGTDHADREGDRRRLCDDHPRFDPRRVRNHDLPRHGDDLDAVGHRRRRHYRCGASGHGRCRCEVRPAMSADNVIEAKGLTKTYGHAIAVDHISFTVGRGEIFGLLGPNGAGKTTTILMLLGLTEISSGDVSVLGFNPAREPLSVKRRVGYLPDTVGFYDQMTAVDNLSYTARLIGFRKAEREKRIADALARVGLTEAAENRVGTFSRGMRQRLGLAEILMKGAQVAILDEPTSGLDPHATAELLAIIRGFKGEGVTVLLSSHLLERVQSVCDRVALFSGGHIALMGTVAELGREVLGGGYVVDIEADGAGLAERLTLIPGVSGVERTGIGKLRLHADRDVRPEAAAEVVAMQGRLKYLGVQEPSLDAIYTRYFEVKAQEEASAKAGARHAA